jgi:enoyl-CoA hydratase/carnithine racemase
MPKWASEVSFRSHRYGGTQRLPQLIGKDAMEMIMTAGMVGAEEAHRTGLVNHVVCHKQKF